MLKYPFSIVLNDGTAFPNMPSGPLLVLGQHDQAVAYTDYDGNMDRTHPEELIDGKMELYIMINNDRHSIMAWHGQRKNQNDHFDNGRRLGLINWRDAAENKAGRKSRRRNHQ